MRLPRLLGFRGSLGMLLTGGPITAARALRMGVVDMLMPSTQTTSTQVSEHKFSYNYEWLTSVLTCLDRKKVGQKDILVESQHSELVATESIDVIKEGQDSEDELMMFVGRNWKDCERKAIEKYPVRRGLVHLVLSYLMNSFFYAMVLLKLWWQVGSRMPAPYICLLTVFRCLYAGSWKEAMILNSLGFSLLAVTAESKGLMSLFLLSRKLKSLAVGFGLGPTEKPQGVSSENTTILILISKQGLPFASAVIQGLLYSGFKVRVVDVSESLAKPHVENVVQKLFDYSVKRKRLSKKDVAQKLSLLTLNHSSDIDEALLDDIVATGNVVFVADCSLSEKGVKEIVSFMKKHIRHVRTVDYLLFTYLCYVMYTDTVKLHFTEYFYTFVFQRCHFLLLFSQLTSLLSWNVWLSGINYSEVLFYSRHIDICIVFICDQHMSYDTTVSLFFIITLPSGSPSVCHSQRGAW